VSASFKFKIAKSGMSSSVENFRRHSISDNNLSKFECIDDVRVLKDFSKSA